MSNRAEARRRKREDVNKLKARVRELEGQTNARTLAQKLEAMEHRAGQIEQAVIRAGNLQQDIIALVNRVLPIVSKACLDDGLTAEDLEVLELYLGRKEPEPPQPPEDTLEDIPEAAGEVPPGE